MIPGKRRGLMLVLSSPSGAGKTSICKALLEKEAELHMSVSVTTRPKRPGEIDGEDYFFIDRQKFAEMADKGQLLEHAEVYKHSYGTPKELVMHRLSQGLDVMFDLDWQGAQQIREVARSDMVGIFILPPDITSLEARLRKRAQDSEAVLQYRLNQISSDVTHWPEYDYVLINRDLEQSVQAVSNILSAERLRRSRQPGLTEFVNQFRQ